MLGCKRGNDSDEAEIANQKAHTVADWRLMFIVKAVLKWVYILEMGMIGGIPPNMFL